MPDKRASWEEPIIFVYPIFKSFDLVRSWILVPVYLYVCQSVGPYTFCMFICACVVEPCF